MFEQMLVSVSDSSFLNSSTIPLAVLQITNVVRQFMGAVVVHVESDNRQGAVLSSSLSSSSGCETTRTTAREGR
jgi:hypothetical protein